MGERRRYCLVCFAVGLAVVAGAGASACSGAEVPSEPTTSTTITLDEGLDYQLEFSLTLTQGSSLYDTYLVPWTEAVEAAAAGRVSFDMGPDYLLKDYASTLRDVLEGRADLTVFEPSWVPGEYPLLELAQLPMLFPDAQVAARVMLQLIEEYGATEFEGLHVLGFMADGTCQYGGTRPVRGSADLQGLPVWSESGLGADIVEVLGGSPTEAGPLSLADFMTKDESGGVFLPWPFHAANTNKWATYWTGCDLYLWRPRLLVMSQEKWDSLPEAVQRSFTDNSGAEASAKYLADDAKYNYDNSLVPALRDRGYDYLAVKARARTLGYPVYWLDDAERDEWRAAVQPIWQAWVDRYTGALPTQEILDRALESIEEHSAD